MKGIKSYTELKRLFLKHGFIEKRNNKHCIMYKGSAWVSIPNHKKDVPIGLFKCLLKQANITL
jgi:hypothetical protein